MKKNVNLPVIAVAICAVCLIAVVGTLAFRATSNSPAIETTPSTDYNYNNPYENMPSSTLQAILNTTSDVYSNTFVPSSATTSTTLPSATVTVPSTTKPTTTVPTTTVPVEELTEEITVPETPEEITQHASGNQAQAVKPTGNLPQDMSFAGLSVLGYDVIGFKDYIYNDDKDPQCFQKNFGYNRLYDLGANLIDFSIETTRLDFKYDNKDYRIQFWKGQYISGEIGTVGGEIGVYTRPTGSVSMVEHYNCAAEEDWLKMEMTVYWDEFDNGEYLPQLTRNYNDFWWATGFVDGQLKNRRDSNSMRVLGRITFETVEQAEAFDSAMSKKGFTKVENFSPYEIDTYKRYEKDVIFLWQNIR